MGAYHFLEMIKLGRSVLKGKDLEEFQKSLGINSYFAHCESILLAALTDQDLSVRKQAVDLILEARKGAFFVMVPFSVVPFLLVPFIRCLFLVCPFSVVPFSRYTHQISVADLAFDDVICLLHSRLQITKSPLSLALTTFLTRL